MSRKTIYVILITLAGLIVLGGVIWYLFFNPTEVTAPSGADFTTPGITPTVAEKVSAISSGPAIAAYYSPGQGSVLFYDYAGKLWQLNNAASAPEIVPQNPIENIADVIWSKNLINIVQAGTNNLDARYIFSDFSQKIAADLRSGIKSLAFSPDNGKIVYSVLENQKTNALIISNPDGSRQKILINNLKLRDFILSWPKVNVIGLTSRPSGLVLGSAWTLNTGSLALTKVIDTLPGLETLWSPDGSMMAYSFVNQNASNPKLGISKNGELKEVSGISTLVGKCAWTGDSLYLYCAAPKSWPEGMVLPDDFYKKTVLTGDDIWKINTSTGEKELIISELGNVSSIIVGTDILYFISGANQYLYRLNSAE